MQHIMYQRIIKVSIKQGQKRRNRLIVKFLMRHLLGLGKIFNLDSLT